MWPYIRCFCGRSLGQYFDLYKRLARQKYIDFFKKEGIDVNPVHIPISENIPVTHEDIFKKLNITSECCITRMLTQVEFIEYWS